MKSSVPSPEGKKPFVPWYDSDALCLLVLLLLGGILIFGVIGIWEARENPLYHNSTWVPVLLVFLNCVVIISTTVRLILRALARLLR